MFLGRHLKMTKPFFVLFNKACVFREASEMTKHLFGIMSENSLQNK